MRPSLALLLLSGLTLSGLTMHSASAQVGGQPPAPTPAARPPVPAAPPAIPVPDGPVVSRQELEGGLIVEDITIGDGYEIKAGGTLLAHYQGTLKSDGMVFDSSFKRGTPMPFTLSTMVAGWQKGIPGMKVGGVRRLTVPGALGYGASGNPNASIPPNADLMFTIQMVDALVVEDLKVGEGEAAGEQCVAVAAHTVKDKDGKEVEKSDVTHPYIWIPGEMVPPGGQFDTMQQALAGMKVGGKRRVSIPGAMNVTPPQLNVARPQNVPITIEIDLIAVRNLPGGGGGGGRRR